MLPLLAPVPLAAATSHALTASHRRRNRTPGTCHQRQQATRSPRQGTQRAAGKGFAVAGKFFETILSFLMPDAPPTPDQLGRMIAKQERDDDAQEKEHYISQHERILERQQEQTERQEQQRDYYKKNRERER